MKQRTFPRTYVLNIGMAVNGKPDNTKGALMVALAHAGLLPITTNYHTSDSEETAVLQFDERPTNVQVRQLCSELEQEAIVRVEFPSGKGELFGPKAEAWGPFDPTFFVMPDGSRLKQYGQAPALGAWGNGK